MFIHSDSLSLCCTTQTRGQPWGLLPSLHGHSTFQELLQILFRFISAKSISTPHFYQRRQEHSGHHGGIHR